MTQTPKARALSPEELAATGASERPDPRMTSLTDADVAGLHNTRPVAVDARPPLASPVPSAVPSALSDVQADNNSTTPTGSADDAADAVDPEDVRTMMDPRDLSDLREAADVTGAPVDGDIPVTLVPPDEGSTSQD